MTSWGAILLGSTLIAGIYGMNFRHMPELHWQYGYPFALGLMLLLTVVGLLVLQEEGLVVATGSAPRHCPDATRGVGSGPA